MATTGEINNLITAARAGTVNIKPLALKLRSQGQVFIAEALERMQDCVLSLSRALTATAELSTSPGELDPDMAVQPGDVLTTAGVFDGSITIRAIADAASGARRVMLDVVYYPPVNLGSFAGVLAFSESIDAILPQGRYPYTATHPAAQTISLGPFETKQTVEAWTIYLVSYSQLIDKQLVLDVVAGTPRRVVSVTSTAGLDGSRIAPATLQTASFAATIRPVALVSSNPALPNALYPPGIGIVYNTSDHTLYKVNVAGTGWGKMVDAGTDVVANSITFGQMAGGAIRTQELYAGEILVGGGGGKPTRFRVNAADNSMVSYIGDLGGSLGYGCYFLNARIGPDINAPIVTADSSGVTIDGAKMEVSADSLGTTVTIDPSSTNSAIRIRRGTSPYSTLHLGQVGGAAHPDIVSIGDESTGYPEVRVSTRYVSIMESADGPFAGISAESTGATGWWTCGPAGVSIVVGPAGAPVASINVGSGSYKLNGFDVINSSSQFVGAGVACTGYSVAAAGFNPYSGGVQYTGLAAISQVVLAGVATTRLVRHGTTDLEYSDDGGSNWAPVGSGGVPFPQSWTTKTFTGYGGVITAIS